MTDRTLVLCKPDAVERKLVGEIIRRIEAKNLTIVALELRTLEVDVAQVHYAEHDGKPFFDDLVEFITRSPIVAMVVEGEGAQPIVRTLMGSRTRLTRRRARSGAISRSSSPRTSSTAPIRPNRPLGRSRSSFPGSPERA